MPSIGYCILLSTIFELLLNYHKKIIRFISYLILLCILILFSIKNIYRGLDWSNRLNISISAIKEQPNNGKMLSGMAVFLQDSRYIDRYNELGTPNDYYWKTAKITPDYISYYSHWLSYLWKNQQYNEITKVIDYALTYCKPRYYKRYNEYRWFGNFRASQAYTHLIVIYAYADRIAELNNDINQRIQLLNKVKYYYDNSTHTNKYMVIYQLEDFIQKYGKQQFYHFITKWKYNEIIGWKNF